MSWQFWLLINCWPALPVWGHVRFAERPSTTWRSVQLFPQLQWQTRNNSTEKPLTIAQYAQLDLVQLCHCEAEDFVHNYELKAENGTLSVEQHVNHFGRTKVGEFGTMRDLCLDHLGLPVRRLCVAAATWQQLGNVTCRAGNQLSRGLNRLREQLQHVELQHKPVIFRQLSNLLSQAHGQLAAVDVYTTAQMFRLLVSDSDYGNDNEALPANLINICAEIMSSTKQVLRLAAELNATNSLLQQFEAYMDGLPHRFVPQASCGKQLLPEPAEPSRMRVQLVNFSHMGVQAMMSSNLKVFYVNPSCSNITGMAIYTAPAADRYYAGGDFWYRFLYANASVQQLGHEWQLETAAYLPAQLWQQLEQRGASYLIFKIYAHDALFVETAEQRSRRPSGKVLAISIPGLAATQLPGALPFLLRKPPSARGDCGYWNYKSWMDNGITTDHSHEWQHYVLCEALHLTQFSFLIGGSYAQQAEAEDSQLQRHEQLLDMITFVGCALSLFGLLGIFLTAALVKKWRDEASTKVLLHLCLALSLQLSLFGLLSASNGSLLQHSHLCLLAGAALQYSVLVIFTWMLIIAFLQFQRYVTVIGVARPQHYILISALLAWTLPLLPTLLVVLLDKQSYKPSDHQTGLCYPSGYGLALGVVLPIALITIVNCFMMICIVYSIYRVLHPRRQLIVQQLRLSVLLFFLLGLTWIFGLCSYLHLSIVFSYLFCLTATLQGFVLFVYFVLLNSSNRSAWLGLLWPKQRKMAVPRRSTDVSTTSTSFINRSQSSL